MEYINSRKQIRKNNIRKISIAALALLTGMVSRLVVEAHAESRISDNANQEKPAIVVEENYDFFELENEESAMAEFDNIENVTNGNADNVGFERELYPEEVTKEVVGVIAPQISPISVSCMKISWTPEINRSYETKVITNAPYSENIRFVYKENGLVYLTGLRENSEYSVVITPINCGENEVPVSAQVTAKTESVVPLVEYGREEGWTNCFCYERASGLTAMPSSGAISGTITDPITDTGIRRNKYGDYCCAMGLWYGEVGDRFLVELDNGIQFTTQICDSKGWGDDADGDGICDGRFHWYGEDNGKCVIEFIYDDGSLPYCVTQTGSYGYWNWGGLNLGANIKKITMIGKGEIVEY